MRGENMCPANAEERKFILEHRVPDGPWSVRRVDGTTFEVVSIKGEKIATVYHEDVARLLAGLS